MIDNIKVTITYSLSKEGQKASLLAGGDGKSNQSLTGDVSAEFINLFDVDTNGKLELQVAYASELGHYYGKSSYGFKNKLFDTPQTLEELVQFVRDRNAGVNDILRNAEQEHIDERISYFIKIASGGDNSYGQVRADGAIRINSIPDIFVEPNHVRFDEVKKAVDERTARNAAKQAEKEEADRKRRAEIDARSEAELALESAKADYIATWVTENGTENQKQRFAAGVLPQEEVTVAVRASIFSVADVVFDAYERIENREVRAECDDGCACSYEPDYCNVTVKVNLLGEMTAEQWEQGQKIKQLLPNAAISLREHAGSCESSNCENSIIRLGFFVKVKEGPFTFNKEFAVK